MKVLHITPHLGGGVGTVIMDWMDKVKDHKVISLDYANDKALKRGEGKWLNGSRAIFCLDGVEEEIHKADVVLVHYWDHPLLAELFSHPLPDCRMVFWCHKNTFYPLEQIHYPDKFINTSPIQMPLSGFDYIWSTGNMDRFLAIEPKPHEGFNIGYVGTVDWKKIHPRFLDMCFEIKDRHIPDVHFTIVGENHIGGQGAKLFTFAGKVDDVTPYLAEMDVFAYPLRPDHYGTCEIALGEAMCAGVVPVVMDNPAERLICKGMTVHTEEAFILEVRALEYPKIRIPLAAQARERARKLYSIDSMIASWNQVFEEMMEKPKTKRSPI